MSVKWVAICYPKPQSRDEFIRIALELKELSQQTEGCIHYEVNLETSYERILFIEEWENHEILDLHIARQLDLLDQLKDLSEKPAEVIFYKNL